MKEEEFNSELEQFVEKEVNLAIEKLKQDSIALSKSRRINKKPTTYENPNIYKALANGKIIKESNSLTIEETIPNINMPNYISYYNPWTIQTTPKWHGITEPEKEQQKEKPMNYSCRNIKVSTYYNGSICIDTGLRIYETCLMEKGKSVFTQTTKGKDAAIECHNEAINMIKQRLEILKKIKKCGIN